jgi:hypothetical protein
MLKYRTLFQLHVNFYPLLSIHFHFVELLKKNPKLNFV